MKESTVGLPSFESVLACRTEEELRAQINGYAGAFGFATWVYVAKPNWLRSPPYVLSSFPSSWIAPRPETIAAESDPAIARCRDTTLPFVWDGACSEEELALVCPSYFRKTSELGLSAGINVPVHGLGCQWGVLSLATTQHLRTGRARMFQLAGAVLLGLATHQAAHGLSLRTRLPELKLTPREIECLHWAALGKTGWEISQLVGISQRTVSFHIDNAAHKLGVYGRRQAVARAIALHLIDL